MFSFPRLLRRSRVNRAVRSIFRMLMGAALCVFRTIWRRCSMKGMRTARRETRNSHRLFRNPQQMSRSPSDLVASLSELIISLTSQLNASFLCQQLEMFSMNYYQSPVGMPSALAFRDISNYLLSKAHISTVHHRPTDEAQRKIYSEEWHRGVFDFSQQQCEQTRRSSAASIRLELFSQTWAEHLRILETLGQSEMRSRLFATQFTE